jgi:hypothetical protein
VSSISRREGRLRPDPSERFRPSDSPVSSMAGTSTIYKDNINIYIYKNTIKYYLSIDIYK